MPVKAKICGLTVPEDAEAAAKAGASYLGVVFAGGPRRVTVTAAAGIVAAGGPIPVFGVFSNQGVEEILRISDKAGLRGAQLHGPYAAGAGEALRLRGLLVWRVVRVAAAARPRPCSATQLSMPMRYLSSPWFRMRSVVPVCRSISSIAQQARARSRRTHDGAGRWPHPDHGRPRSGPRSTRGRDVSSGVEDRRERRTQKKSRDSWRPCLAIALSPERAVGGRFGPYGGRYVPGDTRRGIGRPCRAL